MDVSEEPPDGAEEADDAGFDGPPVVLSHIAYFSVPLPEPLGLPDA